MTINKLTDGLMVNEFSIDQWVRSLDGDTDGPERAAGAVKTLIRMLLDYTASEVCEEMLEDLAAAQDGYQWVTPDTMHVRREIKIQVPAHTSSQAIDDVLYGGSLGSVLHGAVGGPVKVSRA